MLQPIRSRPVVARLAVLALSAFISSDAAAQCDPDYIFTGFCSLRAQGGDGIHANWCGTCTTGTAPNLVWHNNWGGEGPTSASVLAQLPTAGSNVLIGPPWVLTSSCVIPALNCYQVMTGAQAPAAGNVNHLNGAYLVHNGGGSTVHVAANVGTLEAHSGTLRALSPATADIANLLVDPPPPNFYAVDVSDLFLGTLDVRRRTLQFTSSGGGDHFVTINGLLRLTPGTPVTTTVINHPDNFVEVIPPGGVRIEDAPGLAQWSGGNFEYTGDFFEVFGDFTMGGPANTISIAGETVEIGPDDTFTISNSLFQTDVIGAGLLDFTVGNTVPAGADITIENLHLGGSTHQTNTINGEASVTDTLVATKGTVQSTDPLGAGRLIVGEDATGQIGGDPAIGLTIRLRELDIDGVVEHTGGPSGLATIIDGTVVDVAGDLIFNGEPAVRTIQGRLNPVFSSEAVIRIQGGASIQGQAARTFQRLLPGNFRFENLIGGSLQILSTWIFSTGVQYYSDPGSSTTVGAAGSLSLQGGGVGGGTWDNQGTLLLNGYAFDQAQLTNTGTVVSSGGWNITATHLLNHATLQVDGDLLIVDSRLENLASFLMSNGTFTGQVAGGALNLLINAAQWRFEQTQATNAMPLFNSLTGEMVFDGVSWQQSTNDITNHGLMSFEGTNSLECMAGASFIVLPNGVVLIDSGATSIAGDVELYGQCGVRGGAVFSIEDGSHVSGDGEVSVEDAGSALIATGATLDLSNLHVDVNALVTLNELSQATISVAAFSGALNIDSSTLTADALFATLFGALAVDGPSPLEGGPTPSVVRISESLAHEMQDETRWQWGPGAALELIGGIGAPVGNWPNWTRLEVGGTDMGNVGAGFTNNFDLSILRIGPGAHAYIQDAVDNGNRGSGGTTPEALYVDVLEFADPDARLNLNGLNIYYGSIIGEASQIIDVPVPPAIPGDINGDGVVNINDLLAVIIQWGACPIPPIVCPADVNDDGVVNINDLLAVIINWG